MYIIEITEDNEITKFGLSETETTEINKYEIPEHCQYN